MKKFTILLRSFFLLLFIGISAAQAQNCSLFTGSGGDIFPDKRCAPVGVIFQARFFSPAGPDVLTDIKIRVDWADGSAAETYTPSATLSADGKTWTYEIKNIAHTYPEGGAKCNYEVYARPVISGTVCNSYFYKGNVTVWDKDNANGGQIAINPQYYYVCPGEEFSITFNDVSVWNCTPPLENDNINWPARWTQFIYGTNTTPGPRINDIEVNGAVQPYAYRGDIKPHADWQMGPDHTSYLVKVPASAVVGEMFEITLRNWNACNPYDNPAVAGEPGNVQDGDFAPVTNIAIIKIVDRPAGTITTRNKANLVTDNFCPGEKINFSGQQTVASITDVQYDWLVYNDAAGTELLQEKTDTKVWSRNDGFPTAGPKLIKLRMKNKQAANACWTEVEKIVNVYAAPKVEPMLNGAAGSYLEVCWSGASTDMVWGFDLFSGNNYKYQLSLYKRNSGATAPDSTTFVEQNVAGGQSFTANHSSSISKPGSYKVRIVATDRITGCSIEQVSEVVVLDKPLVAFSFPDLCEGQAVTFTNATKLPLSVKGDTIKTWQWDVDYDGSTFSIDYSGKEPVKHTYPAAGSYQVALLVTTEKGCSDMLVQTVQVKPVPKAVLSYNYTQPICPGEPVLFTNLSSNDVSQFPEGITYTLVISDNETATRYPMTTTTQELNFVNAGESIKTFAVWLEAKVNNPNNCSLNSDTLKVDVKPGAVAGFLAPGYDPLQPNCTPLDLLLVTNQATRAINADRYTWTVTLGGAEVKKLVQNRGDAGFDTLRYSALNSTTGSLTYTVRLVAEKANKCVIPAEQKYRVNPVPSSAFTVTQISQTCEETVLEVEVNNPAGIQKYNWTIFPEPANIASVVYNEKFQLVYKRPTVTAPAYEVDLSLVTENYYECPSPATARKAAIMPQQLDDVKVVIVSPNREGCSPLAVDFENKTGFSPTGTVYSVMLRHGSLPEEELVPTSGSAASQFSYTFIKEGSYQIWLKATAPDGCVRYQTMPEQVVVYPGPRADFNVDNTAGCAPLTVSLNKANITGIKRSWQVTDLSNNQLVFGPAVFDPASADDFTYITLQNGSTANKQYRISLITESAQGCKADSSLVITVYPEPQALFEVLGGTNICEPYTIQVKNNSSNATGTVYTWEWGDGTSTTSESATLTKTYANTSYTSTLTFPVRLIAKTPSGCAVESMVQVAVAPRVLADFEADRQTGCAPLQVNFTNRSRGNSGDGSGWFIRKPGSDIFEGEGSTLSSYNFTNPGNTTLVYEVRYIAANAAGCSDTLTRQITIHPRIEPQITADVVQGCGPLLVNFQNTAPQQDVQYRWQWGDGSADEITTTAITVKHTFENTSTTTQRKFTVRVTAENAITGCSATFSQEITVFAQVQAMVVPSVTTGCAPLQLSFQNNSQNAEIHSWRVIRTDNGAEVYTTTNRTPEVPLLINETADPLVYEVIYMASSAQTCSNQQVHRITVYPNVTAAFSPDKNADCSPATVVFTNTNVQPGVQYTWQWGDGSADEVATTSMVQHTFENTTTNMQRRFTVRLIAENTITGCSSSISQEIVAFAQVVANVMLSATEGCAPLQIGFQNNSLNAETHHWSIRRTDTGAEVYTTTNRLPDVPLLLNETAAPLVYEVSYKAISAQACQQEQKHLITVYPGIAAAFTMDVNAAACGPTKVFFTNSNIQEGVQYTWQWGDGSANDITTTETQIEHTFTNDRLDRSRFYEVTLKAVNTASGCSSIFRQTVTVYPAVQVAVTPNKDIICAPDAVAFTNRSQNVSTHEWWYRLQGTTDKLEPLNTAEAEYQFTNNTSAVQLYEVVYVGTNSNGCSATSVHTITVYPALEPSFAVDDDRPNLPNAVVNITNTTLFPDAWTYSWNFGDGTSSTEVNPAAKKYEAFGTYIITLTISNGRCSLSYSKEIKVGDTAPVVDFETVPVAGCAPLPVQFNNNSQYTDPNSYYWDFGDGKGYSTAENPTYTYFTPGQYEVTLTARNRTGESKMMTKNMVTVYEVPKADFTVRDAVVYVPGEPVYVANFSVGADTYLWDFGDGTTYTDKNPIHYYQQPGIYSITLIASNQWGCADTLTLNEVVTAEAGGLIKIPNAFTPDPGGPNAGSIDAGNNDVFFPILSGGISKYNMRIYNRWGELLFETKDRNTGWNGYYKGRLCKSDVYAFKIYVEFSDGKTLQQIGDVTLIR